jgi:hypothetical protein
MAQAGAPVRYEFNQAAMQRRNAGADPHETTRWGRGPAPRINRLTLPLQDTISFADAQGNIVGDFPNYWKSNSQNLCANQGIPPRITPANPLVHEGAPNFMNWTMFPVVFKSLARNEIMVVPYACIVTSVPFQGHAFQDDINSNTPLWEPPNVQPFTTSTGNTVGIDLTYIRTERVRDQQGNTVEIPNKNFAVVLRAALNLSNPPDGTHIYFVPMVDDQAYAARVRSFTNVPGPQAWSFSGASFGLALWSALRAGAPILYTGYLSSPDVDMVYATNPSNPSRAAAGPPQQGMLGKLQMQQQIPVMDEAAGPVNIIESVDDLSLKMGLAKRMGVPIVLPATDNFRRSIKNQIMAAFRHTPNFQGFYDVTRVMANDAPAGTTAAVAAILTRNGMYQMQDASAGRSFLTNGSPFLVGATAEEGLALGLIASYYFANRSFPTSRAAAHIQALGVPALVEQVAQRDLQKMGDQRQRATAARAARRAARPPRPKRAPGGKRPAGKRAARPGGKASGKHKALKKGSATAATKLNKARKAQAIEQIRRENLVAGANYAGYHLNPAFQSRINAARARKAARLAAEAAAGIQRPGQDDDSPDPEDFAWIDAMAEGGPQHQAQTGPASGAAPPAYPGPQGPPPPPPRWAGQETQRMPLPRSQTGAAPAALAAPAPIRRRLGPGRRGAIAQDPAQIPRRRRVEEDDDDDEGGLDAKFHRDETMADVTRRDDDDDAEEEDAFGFPTRPSSRTGQAAGQFSHGRRGMAAGQFARGGRASGNFVQRGSSGFSRLYLN